MTDRRPVLWWVRRDLRLDDNPCLQAALAFGAPVIPVVVRDRQTLEMGAAPLYRWGQGVEAFARELQRVNGRLILRSGDPATVLGDLAEQLGAQAILWSRAYDPAGITRDKHVKSVLRAKGLAPQSQCGHLLFEPWTVETKAGGFYRVFTPMWTAVRDRNLPLPQAGPAAWPGPDQWPASECIEGWDLSAAMHRGAMIIEPYRSVGESNARDRLSAFISDGIRDYKIQRDYPSVDGTSRLSAHLAFGEIGPRRCWHAARSALFDGLAGAEQFLKELVWREFAYHLMYHTPEITTRNWRPEWDGFPWSAEVTPEVVAWQQGRTGVPFVDAAMRELYVTGHMHSRARMVVASYLTKHLLTDWRLGQAWFAEHLTDWDPASNALGWQWVAGSGPDAAPFFRVFNPETQLARFDPQGIYTQAWIAEGQTAPPASALAYFDAIPPSWGLSPEDAYPMPVVDLAAGRRRALAAYEDFQNLRASA